MARTGAGEFFPVQLTTSRIGNLTRLIHTLLYVMTIHTYVHTYSQTLIGFPAWMSCRERAVLPQPALGRDMTRAKMPGRNRTTCFFVACKLRSCPPEVGVFTGSFGFPQLPVHQVPFAMNQIRYEITIFITYTVFICVCYWETTFKTIARVPFRLPDSNAVS